MKRTKTSNSSENKVNEKAEGQVVEEVETAPPKVPGTKPEVKEAPIPPKPSRQPKERGVDEEGKESRVQEKKEQEVPQRVYLCGKNLTPTILNEIQKRLNLKPVVLKTNISQIPQGRESELAILLSLAQKKIAPPGDEKSINILPSSLSLKYKKMAQKNLEKTFQVLGCLFLLFFTSLTFVAYSKITREKGLLLGQAAFLEKTEIPLPASFSTEKISLLTQVGKQNKALQEFLEEIFKKTPSEIELSGINFNKEKGELILVGRAKTREDLLKFKDSLAKSQFFQKISIPLSSLEKERGAEFRIVTTISN